MIRYAITDSPGFYANDAELLRLAARWAGGSVNFVQLRAKHLDAGPLTALARKLIAALAPQTKLLISGRVDVAIASSAAGVHLTAAAGELTPEQVRRLFSEAVVSVSCHTIADVEKARDGGADLVLFAPVFEKRVDGAVVLEGAGLEMLSQACAAAAQIKVLALGGVTWENAQQCMEAGAAGIAGIRLFA